MNYRLNLHFAVTPEEEIGPQLRARGIAPDDVRWVVLTHLHPDHAGGVHHFRRAQVLVARDELAALDPAVTRATRLPAWFDPQPVDFDHAPRGPFQRTRTLTVSGDVVLVATPGHSPGHLCVLAESDGVNYLFAGDAAFSQRALLEHALAGVPHDPRQARETLALLLNFVRQTPTVFLPAHDPAAADRLRRRAPVPTA